jgi:hypothetical protein
MQLIVTSITIAIAALSGRCSASAATRGRLAPPVIEGKWLRPSATQPGVPVWGFADGLRVGLWPLDGSPRGLLRVFAPYLHPRPADRLINFIAIEPTVRGQNDRGLSELEHSRLDDVQGKRFWSVDNPTDTKPLPPDHPDHGQIMKVDGVDALRVYVQVENFDNGAAICLRLTFRADRPHEVAIATFARADSAPLKSCIVTATMGNYARLRQLHLRDRIITSHQLWPDFTGDEFAPHAKFDLSQLLRTPEGSAVVSATPDEADPDHANYAPGTARHWRYTGLPAIQTWRCDDPDPALKAQVNGRYEYWQGRSALPGGIAFENFELAQPFHDGQEFRFEVEPMK